MLRLSPPPISKTLKATSNRRGAEAARGAHNPEVTRSKRVVGNPLLYHHTYNNASLFYPPRRRLHRLLFDILRIRMRLPSA